MMTSSVNATPAIELDPTQLQALLAQHPVTLIDVREPSEYAGEHIAGAVLVPLSTLRRRQPHDPLPTELAIAPGAQPETPVVLYCQSGNRSNQAMQLLQSAGMIHLVQLRGGLNAWKQRGLPTQINQKAPISIMRQVQISAGSLVVLGTVLGAFVSPWFLLLSGFVGSGLLFAGITNTCGMALLLARLPYNQQK